MYVQLYVWCIGNTCDVNEWYDIKTQDIKIQSLFFEN